MSYHEIVDSQCPCETCQKRKFKHNVEIVDGDDWDDDFNDDDDFDDD